MAACGFNSAGQWYQGFARGTLELAAETYSRAHFHRQGVPCENIVFVPSLGTPSHVEG